MVDKARVDSLIEELNAMLGDVTPYKLALVAPDEIHPVDKNAHYMSKRVYDQLTANIAADGNLSSLPLCWRNSEGEYVCLSGNHRLEAAKAAGVPLILVLYTDAELTQSEQIAIQLSHNSLVGQDNPTVLAELWREIDELELKIYSGLDEELIDAMEPAPLETVNAARLKFEEFTLLFMQPEVEQIERVLERLGEANRDRLAAHYEDFDRFFNALLDYKEAANIINSATALMALIEIAEKWVAEHNEAEQNEPEE